MYGRAEQVLRFVKFNFSSCFCLNNYFVSKEALAISIKTLRKSLLACHIEEVTL